MNKQTPNKAGPGRPKGSPNKTTAAVKDMIIEALNGAHPEGGAAYLKQQAEKNPVAFMSLLGRVLPLQVGGDPNGVPIEHAHRLDPSGLTDEQLRALGSIKA